MGRGGLEYFATIVFTMVPETFTKIIEDSIVGDFHFW